MIFPHIHRLNMLRDNI